MTPGAHAAPGQLRPVKRHELELIRSWRNAPEVRTYLFSTHEISADEHRRWFERSCADTGRRLWLYEHEGQCSGFMQLSDVVSGGVAEWGFYNAPGAPRGSGRAMGWLALEKAFREEQLHKVFGQTLAGNAASIRFHLALGFRAEGVLREHHRDSEGAYHDIHCFGLVRHDWLTMTANPTS